MAISTASFPMNRQVYGYDIVSTYTNPCDYTTRLELRHCVTKKKVVTPPMCNFEQLFEYLDSLAVLEQ